MTLRDLTKRQLYNLNRKMEKQKKEFFNSYIEQTLNNAFNHGFNKGLKAGLEFAPSQPLGGQPKP